MPPKTIISRQKVEEAAFELVRKEGAEALSARRIAQSLGCSTQPVYTACESMEEVRRVVMERAMRVAEQYLSSPVPNEPPFLQVGLGGLRFAHEEPHLFRLVSEFMRTRLGEPPPPPVLAAMRADPQLSTLSEAQLTRVNSLMWVFSQGLAGFVGPGAPSSAMKTAREYLRLAGQAIVEFEFNRARGHPLKG